MYTMTKITFADLLPYLSLEYDEDDEDNGFMQYDPNENIQLYVTDDVVEVGTVEVRGDKVLFRNMGYEICKIANVDNIECAVLQVKRTKLI